MPRILMPQLGLRSFLLYALVASSLSGCNSGGGGDNTAPPPSTGGGSTTCTTQNGTYFTLSGTATYDWVPAQSVAEGGPRLGYASKQARPVRRAVVQSVSLLGAVLSSGQTDDNGNFSINAPGGCGAAKIRVIAKSSISSNTADGISPDSCNGATWDFRVVDNTNSKANYAMETSESYTSSAAGISVHALTDHQGALGYQRRTGAPFALLDTALTEMELVCSAHPTQTFPLLYINWSASNNTTDGEITTGEIGTSFYTTDALGVSNIYILGEENVDTDEYDDHVVAHELGHYLENAIFRSDSIGGSHSLSDILDPRVAFGEGYGNAISAMTFNDPIYVDTGNDQQQSSTVYLDISAAPTSNARGVYSEKSAQYFLWKLFQSRYSANSAAAFERIYAVLASHQASTPAFTTLLSFASYYNQLYGQNGDSLRTRWETDLDTPYNALCAGACAGTGDTAEPFDFDNDIGVYYSGSPTTARSYGGTAYAAEFWQLYHELFAGTHTATDHDRTEWASYTSFYRYNKLGNSRWYVYRAAGSSNKTFSVANPYNNSGAQSCSTGDAIDMYVYRAGALVGYDETTSSCPSVTLSVTAGNTYLIEVRGWYGSNIELAAWDMVVN